MKPILLLPLHARQPAFHQGYDVHNPWISSRSIPIEDRYRHNPVHGTDPLN